MPQAQIKLSGDDIIAAIRNSVNAPNGHVQLVANVSPQGTLAISAVVTTELVEPAGEAAPEGGVTGVLTSPPA